MSVDLIVHFDAANMPTPQQWQQAITNRGFILTLDTNFDVLSFTGFLPCDCRGKPAGFEYFYEVTGQDNGTRAQITFTTHSDLREFLSSAISAAVLTELRWRA